MVGQVAELQQEQPRRLRPRRRMFEGGGVAMHVAHHPQPAEAPRLEIRLRPRHQASASAGAGTPPSSARAARARARPSACSITGRG